MIFRSGFLRAALATSGAALLFSFAACGGKVVGEGGGGGDDSSSNPPPDGGKNDGNTSTCTGVVSCPVCEGDPNSGQATCVDGEWQCATTKCVPPPPDDCDTTAEPDCSCGTPQCLDDSWTCPGDCGGFCPASVDNLGGQPCVTEGLICGDECGDPCQACNYAVCTSGTWNEVESLPESCDGGAPGH